MDKLTRLYRLHQTLAGRRVGVPLESIMDDLGCSRATANRVIKEMRETFNAPIIFDRDQQGYRYDRSGEGGFELPGLWFSEAELTGLLSMQRWMNQIGGGFVGKMLAPLGEHMRQMLGDRDTTAQISQRIVLQEIGQRPNSAKFFPEIATATLSRVQLEMDYRDRTRNENTSRTASPQRLLHYRDNWYLDAWCHLRNQLRRFALDRIQSVTVLATPAHEIAAETVAREFDRTYGIFGGAPANTAVLRFSGPAAQWVSEEVWHARQQSEWLEDGRYELWIEIGENPAELIQDILRYGDNVEVVDPPELRGMVRDRLRAALDIYGLV